MSWKFAKNNLCAMNMFSKHSAILLNIEDQAEC